MAGTESEKKNSGSENKKIKEAKERKEVEWKYTSLFKRSKLLMVMKYRHIYPEFLFLKDTLHAFFYKNTLCKNMEAEKSPTIKNILKIC